MPMPKLPAGLNLHDPHNVTDDVDMWAKAPELLDPDFDDFFEPTDDVEWINEQGLTFSEILKRIERKTA